jgi:hypothetical protein
MTSLASWIGIDSRGQSSIYIVSDSRISWGENAVWNYGRKVFASRTTPEIFGYCGDVLFPSMFLSQVVDSISIGQLGDLIDPHGRAEKLLRSAQASREGFPRIGDEDSFSILYCSRSGVGMTSCFRAFLIRYSSKDGSWSLSEEEIPSKSGKIIALGSGSQAIAEWDQRWKASSQGGTSRAFFSAFCDSLASRSDPKTGGAPQLVGIRRSLPAEHYGIIWHEQRYLLGLEASNEDTCYDAAEWRNELFERCDFYTMKAVSGAQRHSRPREVSI